MLTEKDYCDYGLIVELEQLGMPIKIDFACGIENGQLVKTKFYPNPPSLYEAQKWLREEKGIHIAPRIYLYHDANLDEQTSWECTIYVEWAAIYTIGKSLTYEGALLLGIKDAIKGLKGE